jgi:LmbE family N-acetylglucosaminyl deacetylase
LTILLVVAHPDDEVLMAGASCHLWAAAGVDVASCILVGNAEARTRRPSDQDLDHDLRRAHEVLGIDRIITGSFPNIALNTVPHLDLVQFIENAVQDVQPDVIITHHPGDLNDDHQQTSRACQAAARLSQRGGETRRLRSFMYGEVLSSTDWAYATDTQPFRPNAFTEVGTGGVEKKLEALACYRNVMRPYPHPRSEDSVRGLATIRGSEAGMRMAEAFELAFLDATDIWG